MMPPSDDYPRISFLNWISGGSLLVNQPRSRVIAGVVTEKRTKAKSSSTFIEVLTAANTEANKKFNAEQKNLCCKECKRDCNCKAEIEAKNQGESQTMDSKPIESTKAAVTGEKTNDEFTAEQDALLRIYKGENKTWKEICSRLGKSKHALHQRYKELMKTDQETAASGTTGSAMVSGAHSLAKIINENNKFQKEEAVKHKGKKDNYDDPFGGLFEETDWGADSGGRKKDDHGNSNGNEWGGWGGDNTKGQTEKVTRHSKRGWSGDNGDKNSSKSNSNNNEAWGGNKNYKGGSNHGGYYRSNGGNNSANEAWGGDQTPNKDTNVDDYGWGGDQTSKHDDWNSNFKDQVTHQNAPLGAGNWDCSGDRTTGNNNNNNTSQSWNSVNPEAGQSSYNGNGNWNSGIQTSNNDSGNWNSPNQATHQNRSASGRDGTFNKNKSWNLNSQAAHHNLNASGRNRTFKNNKNSSWSSNNKAAHQNSNTSNGDCGWGGSPPSEKFDDWNANCNTGTRTALNGKQQIWGEAQDMSSNPCANANVKPRVAPPYNLAQANHYYPYNFPPHPSQFPSFEPALPHPASVRPVPANEFTGRLLPDDIWSPRDCEVLEFLMSRYASEQWMAIQAGFYNWTGRFVPASLIKWKFKRDGVISGGFRGGPVSGGATAGVGGRGDEAWRWM